MTSPSAFCGDCGWEHRGPLPQVQEALAEHHRATKRIAESGLEPQRDMSESATQRRADNIRAKAHYPKLFLS